MPNIPTYGNFFARVHSLYRVVPHISDNGEGEMWLDPLDETLLIAPPVSDSEEFADTHCLLNRVLIDNAHEHHQPVVKSVTNHNQHCVLCRTYASSLLGAN